MVSRKPLVAKGYVFGGQNGEQHSGSSQQTEDFGSCTARKKTLRWLSESLRETLGLYKERRNGFLDIKHYAGYIYSEHKEPLRSLRLITFFSVMILVERGRHAAFKFRALDAFLSVLDTRTTDYKEDSPYS